MATKRLMLGAIPTKYLIDVYGNIYSEYTKKYLKPYPNKNGYMLIDIFVNGVAYTRQVHRLVALTFIPNPNKLPEVNHKDGNKKNNSVRNLEWMSHIDNVHHAWETGLAKPRYGVDNPANVYTEEQIHLVCKMLEAGIRSNKYIAYKCNVNVTLIRDIKFRGKWKHISDLYDINKIPIGFKSYRAKVIEMIENGYSNREILAALNVPNMTLRHISGVRYRYNLKKKSDAASTTNRGTS